MKKIFVMAVLLFSVILFMSVGSSKTSCGSETYSVSGSSGSYSTTNIDTSSYDGCEAEITKIEMDGDTDSGGEWMRAYWGGNSVDYDGSNVHCGRYTVWTGSDNRGEVGNSVEIGVDSDYSNDCGSQKVIFHVDFWSYNSPPDISNPRPTTSADTESPELKVDVSDPDNDDMDVTFYDESGSGTTTIGEAGKQTSMNNNNWYSDSFNNGYSSTPLVFATTQTTNGGQDPSSAHLRNIDTNGFDTQHCEFDGGNSCDSHNREDNGWLAIDPSSLDSVQGIEAGTIQTTSGSGSYSVSFSSMTQTPLFFTQSQTSDGAPTLNTQARNVDSNSAYVEFCEQENQDGCEGHTTEEVAWLAIDPSQISESAGFEFGTTTVHDSSWNSISLDRSFSNPIVLVDVQTENGGQEALYPEADHVGTGGADIRYCESEADDDCDTHAGETVAWLALDIGTVQLDSAQANIGVDNNVADGSTASVTWNDAVCGTTNSWSASASDGTASTSTSTLDFTLNCNDPPSVDSLSVSDGSSHSLTAEAQVSDPDGNLDRCEFTFDSSAGSTTRTDNSPSGTCSSGEVPSSDLGTDHLENPDVTVRVFDTQGESDSSMTSDTFPNHPPQAGSLTFTDYIAFHGFNATASVSDPDGGLGELDRCDWTISSPDKTVTETTSPVTGPECKLVNVSNVMQGFEVGDDIDVKVDLFDLHGSSVTSQDTHPIKNSPPVFSQPRPPNTSVVADDVPQLSVAVEDPEDSPLDVYFFDGNGNLIGKDSAIAGRRGAVNWTGLRAGKTYDWHVNISDGYTNVSNNGNPWNFTKTLSGRYRLMTEIEDRYTSIITTVDKLSYLTYSVSNPVSENRSVNLTLRGINSSFTDGSVSKEFELGSYETEQFQLQIQPQNNGTKSLEIVARDRELGISEVEEVEVLVKEVQTSTRRAEDVPGVGLVQVLVLSLAASMFWIKF